VLPHPERSNGNELYPANTDGHPAAAMGQVDRDPLALMDGALFMRVHAVHLGMGRHPLEGCGSASKIPEVSAVRPTLLAHADSRADGGIDAGQDMKRGSRPSGLGHARRCDDDGKSLGCELGVRPDRTYRRRTPP
jgi:hypothetical protein